MCVQNQDNNPLRPTATCLPENADALRLRLAGAWGLARGIPGTEDFQQALQGGVRRVICENDGITAWDSSLLVFLRAVMGMCRTADVELALEGFPAGVRKLLDLAQSSSAGASADLPASAHGLRLMLGQMWSGLLAGVEFVGALVLALVRLPTGRIRFRHVDFWATFQESGPEALPIITVISLLVGAILAFLGALQLKLFGAEIFIADLVAVGMAREMGALMTGIIMAGRTGAAFAARLGTMQVNEEIDALRTLGLDPVEFLVLPRALALILVMPLLTVYANFIGMLGGGLAGVALFELTVAQYYHQTVNAVTMPAVFSGIIKGSVYGVLIAISGCLQGLRCGRSAAAVGDAATAAVVNAIVAIIVADAVLSILFTMLEF